MINISLNFFLFDLSKALWKGFQYAFSIARAIINDGIVPPILVKLHHTDTIIIAATATSLFYWWTLRWKVSKVPLVDQPSWARIIAHENDRKKCVSPSRDLSPRPKVYETFSMNSAVQRQQKDVNPRSCVLHDNFRDWLASQGKRHCTIKQDCNYAEEYGQELTLYKKSRVQSVVRLTGDRFNDYRTTAVSIFPKMSCSKMRSIGWERFIPLERLTAYSMQLKYIITTGRFMTDRNKCRAKNNCLHRYWATLSA